MFTGKYYHVLDAKARVFIPAKFRDELGVSFHIAKEADGSLIVVSTPEWEKFIGKLLEKPMAETMALRRFYSELDIEVTPDAQGRVVLPPEHRKYIGADTADNKNLVIIGDFDRVKIWSEEAWVRMQAQTRPEDVMAALRSLGI